MPVVLDYLQFAPQSRRKGSRSHPTLVPGAHYLEIPAFHSGTLGFMPNVEVSINFANTKLKSEPGPSSVELYVTPFERSLGHMVRLECLLYDGIGVVNRLLDAVSSLELNVVKQESCMVNNGEHHFVELLLEWTGNQRLRERITPPASDAFYYGRLGSRIDLGDRRCTLLYEAIMARCADVIVFDVANGSPLPHIAMSAFSHRHLHAQGNATLLSTREIVSKDLLSRLTNDLRKKSPLVRHPLQHSVLLPLSEQQVESIRSRCGYSRKELFPYVIASESNSRTLRAFIPKKEDLSTYLHVAFTHDDAPGVLGDISSLLALGKFNIITSLLRKIESNRSKWELVLQYRGQHSDLPGLKVPKADDDRPFPRHSDRAASWLADILNGLPSDSNVGGRRRRALADQLLKNVVLRGVRVETPDYPRVKKPVSTALVPVGGRTPSPRAYARKRTTPFKPNAIARVTNVRERQGARASGKTSLPHQEQRIEFAQAVRDRLRAARPVIFVSYPHYAQGHGQAVMQSKNLNDAFDLTDFQESDPNDIVPKVTELVERADFFIGIWHHEDVAGTDSCGISPWMPFEYGLAMAAHKPCVVVHSSRLPHQITQRIEPGIGHPAYDDLTFVTHTVPMIEDFCIENWKPTVPWFEHIPPPILK
jgi:hypothetical protein